VPHLESDIVGRGHYRRLTLHLQDWPPITVAAGSTPQTFADRSVLSGQSITSIFRSFVARSTPWSA
jgi:hypothetical protein